MPSEHCAIPPSSAARRVQCQGSWLMEQMYPDTGDNEEAMIGTASHELFVPMIEAATKGGLNFPKPQDVIGKKATNGIEWDQASYDGALMFSDEIERIMRETDCYNPVVEQRIAVPRIHPELWGTPDCRLFSTKQMKLYVADYKFGHRPVEAFENYQMIEYAVGCLDEITTGNGLIDSDIEVEIIIVQPRAPHWQGPIRRWCINGGDLRGYANMLYNVEHTALSGKAACNTGPECRDCSARHACGTLQAATGGVMDFASEPIPTDLDPMALGTEITLLRRADELLSARLKGLEAQAEGLILSGGDINMLGYSLQQDYGHKKWAVSNDEVFIMGDLSGVELRKDPEPITPTQAQKAGIDETVIKAYSITPRTGFKLVPSENTIASAVFAKR